MERSTTQGPGPTPSTVRLPTSPTKQSADPLGLDGLTYCPPRHERVRLVELPDYFQGLATSSGTLSNLYFSPNGEKLLYQSLKDIEIPQNLIPQLPASSTQKETRMLKPGAWYVYDLAGVFVE